MTNGEKIKEIFPNAEYLECEVVMDVVFAQNQENWFDLEWWNAEYKEPTPKNNLGVDCIDRAELLKAIDTWDKFGYSTRYGLERLDKDDKGFVPYVKYDDMVNCVKGMSSVTSQPCEDAISRKAVLEMAKSYNADGWDMYTPLVVDVENIEELPSVTPQELIIPINICPYCGEYIGEEE